MKQFMIIALAIFGMSASATALDGKVLRCSFESSEGTITTNYVFLNDGSDQALARSSFRGDNVVEYKLKGSLLTVSDDDGPIRYDISNPNVIVGQRQFCMSPGQGGGGSHGFCSHVADVCKFD